MQYVITEPCIGVKDASCVDVCPVSCIYESAEHYVIHPDECIDCAACEAACPVSAIYHEDSVPEQWHAYTAKNAGLARALR
jgi:NAD-dependent dihydropyrimidine dehydrogenase PreA subunit